MTTEHDELLARLDVVAIQKSPADPNHVEAIWGCVESAAALRKTLAELEAEQENRRTLAKALTKQIEDYNAERIGRAQDLLNATEVVASLARERKALEEAEKMLDIMDTVIAERDAAESKLAEREKYAQRYRLVRNLPGNEPLLTLLESICEEPITPEQFDTAIDAALAQKGEKS
jgi:uncharacterized protein (DUF2344 family)